MLSFETLRYCPGKGEKLKPKLVWALYALVAFCVLIVAATVIICIRHAQRGHTLVPLLDAITSSRICYDDTSGTCAVELDPKAAARFDLHELENPLLGFLYAQVVNKNRGEMAQILQGAHVCVTDTEGSFYDFFKHLPGVWTRISSHQSDREQFGIPEGRVISTVLVGTLNNSTWFQLEADPWDPRHNFRGSFFHVLDYLEYRFTGRNIGPLGTSSSTDRRPLVKGAVQTVQEACPERCPEPHAPGAMLQVAPLMHDHTEKQGRRGRLRQHSLTVGV